MTTDPEALDLIAAGLIAFQHTREYVGDRMLPAIEGWSWYDWTVKAEAFLAASGAAAVPLAEETICTLLGDEPVPAECWAWRLPGEWVAARWDDLTDWLDPGDLAAGVYRDAGMPGSWNRPIQAPPPEETLRWRTPAGVSVAGRANLLRQLEAVRVPS